MGVLPSFLLLLLCTRLGFSQNQLPTEVSPATTSAPFLKECETVLLNKAKAAFSGDVDGQFFILPEDTSSAALEKINPADVPHSLNEINSQTYSADALANASTALVNRLTYTECQKVTGVLKPCDQLALSARGMNLTLYHKNCEPEQDPSGAATCLKRQIFCRAPNSTEKATAKTCDGAANALAFFVLDEKVDGERKCVASSGRLSLLAAASPPTTPAPTTTTTKKPTTTFSTIERLPPTETPPPLTEKPRLGLTLKPTTRLWPESMWSPRVHIKGCRVWNDFGRRKLAARSQRLVVGIGVVAAVASPLLKPHPHPSKDSEEIVSLFPFE